MRLTEMCQLKKIVELDNAAWYTKQTGFDASKFTGNVKNLARSGNVAVMELDGSIYFSHSAFSLPNSPQVKAYQGQYIPVILQKNASTVC